MNFLLDTNVISEPTKPRPDSGVLAWLASVDEDAVFLCAVTIAELRYGVDRMAAGKRRTRLDAWLRNDLRKRFMDRILQIDTDLADLAGRLLAGTEKRGRPMDVRDVYIAACAEHHRMTLVTRNVTDFEAVLDDMVMPWTDSVAERS